MRLFRRILVLIALVAAAALLAAPARSAAEGWSPSSADVTVRSSVGWLLQANPTARADR